MGYRYFTCELSAPQPLALGESLEPHLVASAVGLAPEEIATESHPPLVGSVGLAFLLVEVRDLVALERARVDAAGFEAIMARGIRPSIHLYARVADGFDLRARMFALLSGVPEDPATGSANCALAGLLAHLDPRPTASFSYRVAQGVEMGRPATLQARVRKADGVVRDVRIGGPSVLVSEGVIHVD